MITLALAVLCGLLVGLYWGERSRRLDLLHVRLYQEARPPTSIFQDGLGLIPPIQPGGEAREISDESVELTARYLRQEASGLGRTITPEEAARQARQMLAGQDV